jgi:hypothetical protein
MIRRILMALVKGTSIFHRRGDAATPCPKGEAPDPGSKPFVRQADRASAFVSALLRAFSAPSD